MRIAIISDELAQDIGLVADTCVDFGLHGVEIRSVFDTPPHLLPDERLIEIADLLAVRGLVVAGFAPPVFKCALPHDEQAIDGARESVRHAIRQAVLLGAPHVRVFSWYRIGDPDPASAAAVAREVLAGLTLAVPLVVETGTRTNTPSMTHVVEFLDRIGRDDLGVLWDPGNCVFGGWRDNPFPNDYLLARDRIRHVHVKDPDGQREYVRLGDGDLPWQAIMQHLADDCYQGFVSLETHWRHGRVLDQHQRDEPWGESFSRGGFAASVECMRRLTAWHAQVIAGGG